MIDSEERLERARLNSDDVNCIGFALYYSSVNSEEEHIGGFEGYEKYFSKLVEIERSELSRGDLVSWDHYRKAKSTRVIHAGVVEKLKLFLLIHRSGINENLIKGCSFEGLNLYYGEDYAFGKVIVKYHKPIFING
jgi:hypothetical protein